MADADDSSDDSRGLPVWAMTFADLMTLLMCFFVLLLAFSKTDVLTFKQLSGSMKNAFSVQAEIEVKSIPKGTRVIAREFSPGRPDPTALDQVRQFTIDSDQNSPDLPDRQSENIENARKHAGRLRHALQQELENGRVAVEAEGMKGIIRILEKATFESGRADVRADSAPLLRRIGGFIDNTSGGITVSGHTDNVPISAANTQFRSNWDLSTSRAVSVTHELLSEIGDSDHNLSAYGPDDQYDWPAPATHFFFCRAVAQTGRATRSGV